MELTRITNEKVKLQNKLQKIEEKKKSALNLIGIKLLNKK